MKKTRKRYEAALKARVALAAMKGNNTVAQIAGDEDLHPPQVAAGKKRLTDGVAGVFKRDASTRAAEGFARERTELQSKIGELTIKVDFPTKNPNNPAGAWACRVGRKRASVFAWEDAVRAVGGGAFAAGLQGGF